MGYDEYRLGAVYTCSKSQSRMWIYAFEKKWGMNGTLRVFVDGDAVQAQEAKHHGGFIFEEIMDPGEHKIQVSFQPHKSTTEESGLTIRMFSITSTLAFADCVDRNYCFGMIDPSLSWSNAEQHECLKGASSSPACDAWKQCLNGTSTSIPDSNASSQIDALDQLFTAALTPSSSSRASLLSSSAPSLGATEEKLCYDPRTEHVEEWACNCWEKWQSQCALDPSVNTIIRPNASERFGVARSTETSYATVGSRTIAHQRQPQQRHQRCQSCPFMPPRERQLVRQAR